MITNFLGPYKLEKYEQWIDDINDPMVQRKRGLITRADTIVAIGFDKFFNYGEPQAATIDWNTVIVMEKMDGTNIRLWYDDGQWHISTLGMIDGEQFATLFMSTCVNYGELANSCDPAYTYIFELVTAQNRIVAHYTPEREGIYFLGRRNNATLDEEDAYSNEMLRAQLPAWVKYPQITILHTVEDVIQAANTYDFNHEGFVVRDAAFHRIKIKGEQYIEAAHLHHNGALTPKIICTMVQNGQLDDYLGAFPEDELAIDAWMRKVDWVAIQFEKQWNEYHNYERYQIQKCAPVLVQPYIFARLNGKVDNAHQWLWQLVPAKLINYVDHAQATFFGENS